MTEPYWEQALVDQLVEMARPENPNRAVLAHLRRGLQAPLDYSLARVGWLFRRVPESKDDSWLNNAVLAAGLFAWVKGACPQSKGVNFGQAFGAGLDDDEKKQREKRFIDLLDTDSEDLPYKLRQALTLIARNGVGLDWALLIRHLKNWNDEDRCVQRNWARSFWDYSPVEPPSIAKQTISE